MPVQISTIETLVRQRLDEPTPRYWSSQELTDIIVAGIRDLWRSIVDLKQEHFLTVDETNVTLQANAGQLQGIPNNVYKIYLIESLPDSNPNRGVVFAPRDYNHRDFIHARSRQPVNPLGDTVFYAITGQGSPVNAPTIHVAPTISAPLSLRFVYVPSLGELTTNDIVPIPGEVNNALVAWGVAFARAKERDDRSPDPAWIQIYANEKQNILEGLGLRQLQEAVITDAVFEEYWT